MKRKERAEKFVEVISDYNSWDSWMIKNPGRMAKLLGVCSDGKAAIEELGPSLTVLQQVLRENKRVNLPKVFCLRSIINQRRNLMGDEEKEMIGKGVEKLLGFLELGMKEKKKAAKLSALVVTWERCGFYKDLFIKMFLNDKVNDENKSRALQVYEDMKGLQNALKELRRAIERDDERDMEEQTEKAQKLADKILTGLIGL